MLQELDLLYDDQFGRRQENPVASAEDMMNEAEVGEWGENEDGEEDLVRNVEERMGILMNSERQDDREVIEEADGTDSEEDNEFNVNEFQCRCRTNCVSQFPQEQVQAHIMNIQEMTKEEQDLYIIGVLQPLGVDQTKTWRGELKRKRYGYVYNGKNVCRPTFQYIYNTGRRALTGLITHININGKVPRVHRNKGWTPRHALRYNEIKYCVDLINSDSDEHGLPQPAAPRGRDGEAPVYLPASMTKYGIHKEYVTACKETNIRALGLSSFKSTWAQCVPHIKISNPKDDVCQRCEIIRKQVSDSVTENEKLSAANELSAHIEKARGERELYRQSVKESLEETPTRREVGPVLPVSRDLFKIHYTFAFSQHVIIPHHFRQMGLIYFMAPRRVQVFGVRSGWCQSAIQLFDR